MKPDLVCWTYVSRSRLNDAEEDAGVAAIVAVSRERNQELDVTGALILEDGRFAQRIEGPPLSVSALRASISRDPRHDSIVTIDEGPIAQRRFEKWSLAFHGSSNVLSRSVQRALADVQIGRRRGGEALLAAMIKLVEEQR